jgi:hypothetical protein
MVIAKRPETSDTQEPHLYRRAMADKRPLIEKSEASTTVNGVPILPPLGFTATSHTLSLSVQPHVSPLSSPRSSRKTYTRVQGDANAVERDTPSPVLEEDEEGVVEGFEERPARGLGIATPSRTARRVSIQNVFRGAIGTPTYSLKSPDLLSPPNSADPLIGAFPTDSPASTPDLRRERFSPRNAGGDFHDFRRAPRNGRRSESSLQSVDEYKAYLHSSNRNRFEGATSIASAYGTPFSPTQECPTMKDFYISRWSWIFISGLLVCLFSTVFSGIFLGLALKGPRYGRQITSQGSFKPSDAILLTSIMAKLIELSFVTSFVAFLGQVLSRRAFMKDQGRGVTISELSMWRWVVQPGTLIAHWEAAKYSGLTVLGILSLISAALATLYAPAATAMGK